MFPGQLFIPLVDAARAIGYAESSAYNLHSRGTFPIRVQKQGRKPVISILDLAAYLNAKTEKPGEQPKRRPGRPTKAEQIARRGLVL
jgi:hypothetical protein